MTEIQPLPADVSTDALFVAVYARLKAMAARQLSSWRNATLDTTEVVHELYMRMGQRESLKFDHPSQFFSYAARAAHVVELRYFAGLSLVEAAQTLGLARRTIDRDWRFARAFIKARMQ